MADLYLSAGDNLTGLTFGGKVFGSTGNEIVTYADGVSGITVDQNVEQVRLGGATSAYTYQQSGNQLLIFSGATKVATITLQNDANGTVISFANGSVDAKVSAAGMTLGGTTVPSAAAGTVIPTTIDGSSGTSTPLLNLTVNQDSLVGTAANDLFLANAVLSGGTLVNTLQGIDTIDGGLGTDTLRFTQAENTAVTPTLNNVENVEARFVGTGALNLASSTGIQKITVSGSTAAGTVNGVGTVADLTVSSDVAGNNVTFGGAKAAALTLNLASYGATGAVGTVKITDAALTGLTVNANGTSAKVNEDTATAAYKSLTVNATGTNAIEFQNSGSVETLTVTGAGSLALTGSVTTGVKTVTAGTATGNITGLSLTAAATAVTLGAGNDSVKYTAAVAATATVNLGGGNDTLTLDVAPTAGATLTGGDGTDTIALKSAADYATVSAFSATNLGKITGFEVLQITDILADGSSIDVSKIAGVTSFVTQGVDGAGGKAATVTGITSGSSVTLSGDIDTNTGKLTVAVKDAGTGTADVLNVNIAGDGTATTVTLDTTGVETLNVNTTDSVTTAVAKYTLALTDDALTTLNITGTDQFGFTLAASQTKVVTIDASANTGGVTLDLSAAVAAAPTINLTGTAKNDVFTLGNDVTVKGNGGDDSFVIKAPSNGQTYSTITDINKGDSLTFTDKGVETFAAAKIQLAGTAVFQDYLDAATAGTGAVGAISWFQFGGDTYAVEDLSAATTFQNGADIVVKLTGLVDLSTATGAGTNIITIG